MSGLKNGLTSVVNRRELSECGDERVNERIDGVDEKKDGQPLVFIYCSNFAR